MITGVLVGQDSTAVDEGVKVVKQVEEITAPQVDVVDQIQSNGQPDHSRDIFKFHMEPRYHLKYLITSSESSPYNFYFIL